MGRRSVLGRLRMNLVVEERGESVLGERGRLYQS